MFSFVIYLVGGGRNVLLPIPTSATIRGYMQFSYIF